MKTRVKIVMACCLLHNLIHQWNLEDDLFREAFNEMVEDDDLVDEEDQDIEADYVVGPSDVDMQFVIDFRERLSKDMWEARGPRRV